MNDFPGYHTQSFTTPDERRAAFALPIGERQKMIKWLLFPNKQFADVTKEVSEFHIPVTETGEVGTERVGVLLGESGAGKSSILKAYVRRFPEFIEDCVKKYPALYIEARADWDGLELARQIYGKTGQPYVPKAAISAMNTSIVKRLREHGTHLLIIDEAQCLFESKRSRKNYVSLLKAIVDADSTLVLLAGLPHMEEAMMQEHQLRRRGCVFMYVRAFNPKSKVGKDNFRLFLRGIDIRLPFANPAGLSSPAIADELMDISQGLIGIAMNVIKAAALRALNSQTSAIQATHLRIAAVQMRLVDRKRAAFGVTDEDGSLYA